MVIREADQARAKASQYRGELCSADHQRYLLHIVRGLLYVEDLIYANGQRFICSTSVHQQTGWRMPAANYTKKPDVAIYYYRDTPFYPGFAMNYMQKGPYVVVVNPFVQLGDRQRPRFSLWRFRYQNQPLFLGK